MDPSCLPAVAAIPARRASAGAALPPARAALPPARAPPRLARRASAGAAAPSQSPPRGPAPPAEPPSGSDSEGEVEEFEEGLRRHLAAVAASRAEAAASRAEAAAPRAEAESGTGQGAAEWGLPTENVVRWYRPEMLPKATRLVFADPDLYLLICDFCRCLENLATCEGRIVQAFCVRCRTVIGHHESNRCAGGSLACEGSRFVDALGSVSSLCRACYGRGGGQPRRANRPRRSKKAQAARAPAPAPAAPVGSALAARAKPARAPAGSARAPAGGARAKPARAPAGSARASAGPAREPGGAARAIEAR